MSTEPKRYRRRPLAIQAIHFDGTQEALDAIIAMLRPAMPDVKGKFWSETDAELKSEEGCAILESGCVVVAASNGALIEVMEQSGFEKAYQPMEAE